MTWLLMLAVKSSVILAAGLVASAAARRWSAAVQHWVLAASMAWALALPVLQLVAPSWSLPRAPSAATFGWGAETSSRSGSGVTITAALAAPTSRPVIPVAATLSWLWAAGVLVAAARLSFALRRLQDVARRATPMDSPVWRELAEEIGHRYGLLRPVRLLRSPDPALLVTWGALRPRIVVPAHADEWSRDRVRVVLCHELAHVARGDWAVQMLAAVLQCIHWFNPLAWAAAARLRRLGEHACDDMVLGAGVDGRTYATHLLALARVLTAPRARSIPAPAIAHTSSLERRVSAMLSADVNRSEMPRRARLVVALLAAIAALPLAGLAQTTFFTFSGAVVDPTDRPLPGARLLLANTSTDARYEVTSDGAGRFTFVGLPPGDYALETRFAGFAPLRGSVTVTGQDVSRDVQMQIGSIEETITVTGSHASATSESRDRRQITCVPPDASGSGGKIQPPMMLHRVTPAYPPQAPDARAEEVVVLNARIATDGTIRDLEAAAPAHPAFAAAALDAVRQWQFSETLLNCVPMEISMRVTARFRKDG